MKKNISMILALSASLLLTACPGGGKKGKNWSDKEQALMKEHLYGYVLPSLDVEGAEVVWDADYESISIEADYVTAEQSAALAASLVKDGFDGGLYDEEYYPGFYSFEKEVSTEEGKRFIDVSFATFDAEEEYAESGAFMLQAYDPYFYEWDTVSEYVDYYLEEFYDAPSPDTKVPGIDAERYQIDDSLFMFFDYIDVYAIEPKETIESYGAKLEKAGYTVESGKVSDDEGNEYKYCDGISANKDLEIQAYDFGDYIDIAIMSYVPATAWPSAEIASALTEMEISNVTVPELTGYGEIFYGSMEEDEYGLYYQVTATDEEGDMADKYAAIVGGAENWVVEYDNEYEEYIAYTLHGEACIEFYSEEGSFCAFIYEGDGEEHAPDTTNYGSKEAPLTVSEVLTIAEAQCKADTDTTKQQVFVTGTVKDAGTWNTKGYYNNIVITDGSKDILIYTVNLDSSLGSITLGVGDTISVNGYVKNYKGTIEIADKSVGGSKVYPVMYGYTKKAVVTPTSIELDKTSADLPLGSSVKLTATLGPDGAEGTIEWFSSDETVATVANGVVTPAAGAEVGDECEITAKCGSVTSAACTIVIKDAIEVLGLTLDLTEVTIEAGKSATITANLHPEGASGEVAWTSSDENIATVEGGVVTVKSGATAGSTVTITAACAGFTATCVVTVKEAATTVKDTIKIENLTTVTGTSYETFSGVKGTSGAVYGGKASNNKGIQLNKGKSAGIFSTTSGGKLVSVTVTFSSIPSGKDLSVYASNSAFDFSATASMDPVYKFTASGTYTFTADYAYIGLVAESGAVVMSSIEIVWAA